jgi:type 1 glutamine amidotransferase
MRRALIVWGGWTGHEPEEGARVVAGILREEGFDVRIENSTAAFADPALAGHSLVVPIVTNAAIEKAEAAALSDAVRGGVGLAGYHSMAAAFRSSVDYHFICGGQWVAHPGGIVDYRVEVTRPDDPIMAGIEDFDYRSEQYYLHVDPRASFTQVEPFCRSDFGTKPRASARSYRWYGQVRSPTDLSRKRPALRVSGRQAPGSSSRVGRCTTSTSRLSCRIAAPPEKQNCFHLSEIRSSNEVLATTTFSGEHASWTEGVVMPVAWKRRHGAGRVFYSALGHVAAELDRFETRTILKRGLLWAAR